jgi:hypothetical protein
MIFETVFVPNRITAVVYTGRVCLRSVRWHQLCETVSILPDMPKIITKSGRRSARASRIRCINGGEYSLLWFQITLACVCEYRYLSRWTLVRPVVTSPRSAWEISPTRTKHPNRTSSLGGCMFAPHASPRRVGAELEPGSHQRLPVNQSWNSKTVRSRPGRPYVTTPGDTTIIHCFRPSWHHRKRGTKRIYHALFWTIMAQRDKANKTEPSEQLQDLIDAA